MHPEWLPTRGLTGRQSGLPSIVLVGHDVYGGSPPRSGVEANIAIELSRLVDTIEACQHAGYAFVSSQEFLSEYRRGGLALLTFDDAYRSVQDVAGPALKRLGVPAVVFVVTGSALGNADPFPIWLQALRDFALGGGAVGGLASNPLVRKSINSLGSGDLAEVLEAPLSESFSRMRLSLSQQVLDQIGVEVAKMPGLARATMTGTELKQLVADGGFSLGAHSVTHRSFATLSAKDAEYEIEVSAAELQAISGTPAKETLLAYPFGAVTAHSASVVQKTFAAGLTCQPRPIGPLDSICRLPRINLDEAAIANAGRSDRALLMSLGLRETAALHLRTGPAWRLIGPLVRVMRAARRRRLS